MPELQELVRRMDWRCHVCSHVVSAMTQQGVQDAMDEHALHVNRTADHQTDPHFEDARLDALIAR